MLHSQILLEGYTAIQCCCGTDAPVSSFVEDVELILVLEGTIRIASGNLIHKLQRHQMVLLKRNIYVEFKVDDGDTESGLRYLRFRFKPALLKEFTKWAKVDTPASCEAAAITRIAANDNWLSYIQSLDPVLQGLYPMQTGFVKIKMLELLFHLSAGGQHILPQLLDLRDPTVANITAAVEQNLLNSVSIEQLATLTGRSLSSFRRDFLAIYQMPPSQWIKQKRLEKAHEMLTGTNMTITEIGYITGFTDIAHFSRVFKSHFGFPPSNCRRIQPVTNPASQNIA